MRWLRGRERGVRPAPVPGGQPGRAAVPGRIVEPSARPAQFRRHDAGLPSDPLRIGALRQRLLIPASALLCAFAALADSVTLAPVADTTLLESAPDNNMGGWTHVAAGTTGSQADRTRNRGLFRFDVAGAVPRGARITNAMLTLTVTRVPGTAGGGSRVDSIFGLHRMLKSWGEGDKLGDRGEFATEGEASWHARFHPVETWSAPGAAAPEDFVAQPSAAVFVSGKGTYHFGPTPELVADAQAWLNEPGVNFGWLLLSQREDRPKTARAFGSREDTNNPPSLRIDYEPAVELRIERAEIVGDEFRLSFAAKAGRIHVVEFREAVAEGPWTVVATLVAPPVATNLTARDALTAARRFYRIRIQ